MSEYGNSGAAAQLPSTPETRERSLTLRPSFLLALRGIWLFTWRPQLTWQRFPLGVLMLLALPVLVYLTTPSPNAGDAAMDRWETLWARWERLPRAWPARNCPFGPSNHPSC